MKASLPHILILVTDQFRYDVVSPIITPNLHAFEQRNGSTTFHRAYTSTPTCTPARAALLTGKSPWAHGMLSYGQYTDCANYPSTYPRVFRDVLGYRTIAVGKNHFGPIKHIQGYQNETIYDGLSLYQDDYDYWFNETLPNVDPLATCHLDWNDWPACPYAFEEHFHPTAWTTRRALEYLEEFFSDRSKENWNDTSPPLLLKVSYHRPHSPYDPPRRILEQYLGGGSKSNLYQLERFVNDSSWDITYKHVPMTQSTWAGDPGIQAARHTRAGYLASVEFVDENIGQLFQYLQTHNMWDDFMIVWTSDHGDQNGDHYLWRKGYPWDGNAHIRMVMNPPDSSHRPAQQQRQAIVELRDVAPTLYDMVGILQHVQGQDPLMDGQSLLPILQGHQSSVREWIDLEHGLVYNKTIHWNALVGYLEDLRATPGSPIHCNYWKYIFNAYDASEQLFCLRDDPNETIDLVDREEYQNVVETWRNRMVQQFEREGRGKKWVENNRLQKRQEATLYGDHFPCLPNETSSRQQQSDMSIPPTYA